MRAIMSRDELRIRAIAIQTANGPSKRLRIVSDGTTRGIHTDALRPRICQITRVGMTTGAASQGAIGKTPRRTSKSATQAVMNLEVTSRRAGTLCSQVHQAHALNPSAKIAHLFSDAMADPPCR